MITNLDMNMKRMALLAVSMLAFTASAQDIYKVENLVGEDLNGTARYVGMGGAMSALGADMGVMSTNPAGIGLYRRSDVAITGSVLVQPNGLEFNDKNKARASFDQFGFVYSAKINGDKCKFVNVGFNYHKSRNFKNFIGLDKIGLRAGQSQTYQMADLAAYYGQWVNDHGEASGDWVSPIAHVGYGTWLVDGDDENGYYGLDAGDYTYKRVQWGGIHRYDVNFALNISDRFYVGATVGVSDVRWNSYLDYSEGLLDDGGSMHDYFLTNDEQILGTGVDAKFGFIGRPFADNPLRLGFSVSTPTWYNLTGNNILYVNSPMVETGSTNTFSESELYTGDFDYRIRTPWSFNVSLGTTFGSRLALGAEYDFKDYGSSRVSYPSYDYGYGWDYDAAWGDGYQDRALNEEVKQYLKPVHTLKLGLEARLADNLYARVGYNYVSSPFNDDAIKNLYAGHDNRMGDSESVYNTTGTDYVNLSAINRFTCGLGFKGKHFYADIAYQYQNQSGDVYAFHNIESDATYRKNTLQKQTFDLNRHNVMLTLGYKF